MGTVVYGGSYGTADYGGVYYEHPLRRAPEPAEELLTEEQLKAIEEGAYQAEKARRLNRLRVQEAEELGRQRAVAEVSTEEELAAHRRAVIHELDQGAGYVDD